MVGLQPLTSVLVERTMIPEDPLSDAGLFIGRLHMLLLHLPIGLIALLAALELLSLTKSAREATSAHRFILPIVAVSALCAACCGWVLGEAGGYDGDVLFWHRWTGMALAGFMFLLWGAHRVAGGRFYRLMLVVCVALTMATGHWGGTLTHGRGYLTFLWTDTVKRGGARYVPVAETDDGSAEVAEILEQYCNACHGPEKAKGGLRTDTVEFLLAGGHSGPAVVAGDPDASPVIQRLELPVWDEEHMPPDGKAQPSDEEMAEIRSWILAGAFGED